VTDLAVARAAVAATARALVAAGLVEAFGHVSARTDGGFLLTSTRPLRRAAPGDVLVLDADGEPVAGSADAGPLDAVPLERALHAAVYRRRPDVGAICRGHPRAAVAWGVAARPLPLLHGLGALAGRYVPVHPDPDLVTSAAAADAAADTLAGGHALLLLANGAVAVGRDLDEAATRLWFLDERAAVALAAPGAAAPPSPAPPALPQQTDEPDPWTPRLRHTDAELRRAVAWFRTTFHVPLDGAPPDPQTLRRNDARSA
jgi:HCOMODA/2-hydroxy-3-carboxy-muconic semialdehyde decarboxylase